MPEIKSESKISKVLSVEIFVIAVIALFSFVILGATGLRTILGVILIIFLPFYLVFSRFDLSKGEKIAFSFFVSITLFSSIVYWLGFVLSFKLAIFVTSIILFVAAYFVYRFFKAI